MSKSETINAFKSVANHQDFIMTRIKNCIRHERDKEIVDIVGEENKFDEIISNAGYKFQELLGSILYSEVIKNYYLWRDTCIAIYKIYVRDLSARRLKVNKISEMDREVLKSKFDDLENIQKVLTQYCDTAIARLNALGDDKF
ncbi:hypothetical protein CUREO_1203 [Campylobacter ureolyticus RIGS 9880]|uniref:Uncharacterized protein n=1 Tax=Campylobacter ureolyticus RIGS 9880 TaxID=1032069 RepID=A0AAU8U1K9_9BACT|nr:hypothetical protein [Campylobacter ureolyticus]AKT91048.1 hypothetical protein CUREO_1203 [Campylobacter ureolyticus RIGS 9880]MCZ6172401.1 hypothetical protein [Campylobacter ureolyticus]MDK8323077.1 hypothetical protein [Campylobacter ureolyticus]QIX86864.1 hypothetical protein FOB81_06115 [Campylobacter ureolyticus]STA70833.1 Uncharacterised protein [Campylobacter ureolyticus]